jgi:uncharacterized protein YggE
MHPRLAGATAIVALAALAAGCGTAAAAPADRPAPAGRTGKPAASASATKSTGGSGTIDAQGTGLVQGTPDVLEVSIGVSTTADTAQAALQRANQESGQVISGLKAAGVAAADIQTRDFSIYPGYDSTRKRFTYSVSNTVGAKLRELLKAGAILDDVASGVGNDIRIQGVSFSFSDNSALLAGARTNAVEQARGQAQQLARAAGVKLGRVKSITEDDGGLPTPSSTAKTLQSDTAGAPVPIEPGSESLSVAVHMVYAIAS